ncbi:hypothetical protein IV54_GL001302 [Levilactobacillus paucivorans]|uniref:Uncharacterized protein n=2 Tax=Levilactobacillus paucivorans TaxID=616990 RepID=A0A0R2M104_9LACO|nr:hypothetical protein IV54_GL001302 [Levilactobacillus paucivorans]
MLAPIFIAVLVIAGLSAWVAGRVTATTVGLVSLGVAGLAITVISGLIADLWAHSQTAAHSLNDQQKTGRP